MLIKAKPKLEIVNPKPEEIKQFNPPVVMRGSAMQTAMEFLGDRWLLSPKHSPKKGDYSGWPKK